MVFTEYFMEINFIFMDCYGLFVCFSGIVFDLFLDCEGLFLLLLCLCIVPHVSLVFLQFNFPVLSQTKSSLARFGLEVCFCWTNDFFDSTPSYIF